MLQDIVKRGKTSWRGARLFCFSSDTFLPKTDVTYNSSGIDLWYQREGSTRTAITEATLSATDSAYSSGGFIHVSDGIYRLDLPNAALESASNVNFVDYGGAVTGGVFVGGRIRLVDFDLDDAVRAGLTALPNANAEAAGGLYTRGTGAGQIAQDANGNVRVNLDTIKTQAVTCGAGVTVGAYVGQGTAALAVDSGGRGASDVKYIDGAAMSTHAAGMVPSDVRNIVGAAVSATSAQLGVNAVNIGGAAQTGRDLGASVLLSPGTGTGQLDITAGVVKANLVQILATALTETSGYLAAGFRKFFNVASPTGTANSLPDAIPGASGGLPTTNGAKLNQTVDLTTGQSIGVSGDLSAAMKTSVNAEVLDVLNTDTFAEPGQGDPPATATLAQKIGYLYKTWRNRKTQTSTEWALYNDDTITKGQKATVSDDGTTTTKGEVGTGA